LRKRALRNRAHSDRKSVDVKTKTEGATKAHTCVRHEGSIKAQSIFMRRFLAAYCERRFWTLVDVSHERNTENKVGKTKGEQKKKENLWACLGPTRV